jgi:rhodanese-related sulfurtransferase
MTLKTIEPRDLKRRLDDGSAVLIDIREADEFARERILGARLAPLSGFDQHEFDHDNGKTAVFTCKSGNRTAANASRIIAKGFHEAYMLEGGLNGWKAAGLPVYLDRSAPIDLQRQVQIAAGSLVLASVILGFLASPWFFVLSSAVGVGLMQAGFTGFCGMANLLRLLPWNRRQAA